MNLFSRLMLLTSLMTCCAVHAATDPAPFSIPRTQIIPIEDAETDKQYELYIKLPEGYADNPELSYPVIYFTDAIWHMEILSAATEYLLSNTILVGISWQTDIDESLRQEYGAHASRFSDYSYWKAASPEHPKIQFGQADNHLAFIRNKVFSTIANRFRVEAGERAYFGYSLGGGFGAYVLLTQPETFKYYMLGSPSLHQLTGSQPAVMFQSERAKGARVFISHGDVEKERAEAIAKFISLFTTANKNSVSLDHAVIEGTHQTAFPSTGIASVNWLAAQLKKEH